MKVECVKCGNNYNAYRKKHPNTGQVIVEIALKSNEAYYDIIGIDNKLKAKSKCPQCGTININNED